MLDNFLRNNLSTLEFQDGDLNALATFEDISIVSFFQECGGRNFRDGLYKTHTKRTCIYWSSLIGNYFTKYKEKIIPFGVDWMGRQFAVDLTSHNNLLMFDPATAEYFEFSQNLTSFHNEDLVNDRDSFLEEEKFKKVIKALGQRKIEYNKCIGFKVPLFLNGKDEIENLEIADVEIYWEIQLQIYSQIKDLPPGSRIDSIKFE